MIKRIMAEAILIAMAISLGISMAVLFDGCTVRNSKICLFENDQLVCSKKNTKTQAKVKRIEDEVNCSTIRG